MRVKITENGVEREVDTNGIRVGNVTIGRLLERVVRLETRINEIEKDQKRKDRAFSKSSKILGDD